MRILINSAVVSAALLAQAHVGATAAGMAASANGAALGMPSGAVQSVVTGKCLDLPRGDMASGVTPIQFDCHGGRNQQWAVKSIGDRGRQISSLMNGKCIAVDPDNEASGGKVTMRPCDASFENLWSVNAVRGGYVIMNHANHYCLDVPGASRSSGVAAITWACTGAWNQIWRIGSSIDP